MPAVLAAPLFWSAVAGGGLAAGATVAASRAQGGSSKRAIAAQQQGDQAAMQFEREQEAQRRVEYERAEAEKARQWEAEEMQRQREFQATEEQRLFDRSLVEQREQRLQPYRQAGQQALLRMGDLLKSGSSSPAAWQFAPRKKTLTMGNLLPR